MIDLIFPTDARRASKRDRIEDAVNYKAMAKYILAEIRKSRFHLVESLTEFVARICLQKFKLPEITVRVSKPGAIRGSENVGIQITRRS